MARVRVPAALTSLPVRPVRLVRSFLVAALLRVPTLGLLSAVLLFAAWWVLGRALGVGLVATVGTWSVSVLFAIAGGILGAAVGLALSAEHVVKVAQQDVSAWLERLPRDDGERLVPAVETARLRERYDETFATLFDRSIGRIPMPRFAKRIARERFRRTLVEDFIADCERRAVPTVGFAEVRDFMVRSALPVVTRPAQLQIRAWTFVLLGLLAAGFAVPALVALLARHADPRTVVLAISGGAAVLLLGFGLPRARRHASPLRFRLGLLVIAAGLVLWPQAWIAFWAADIGLVWLVVLAATVWTFQRGVRLVLLDADRPRSSFA